MPASCSEISARLKNGSAIYDSFFGETFTTVRITRGDGSRRSYVGWSGLVPGLNVTFTGAEAAAATFQFDLTMPDFRMAVPSAIGAVIVNRAKGNEGGLAALFAGFSASFAPQKTGERRLTDEELAPIRQELEKMLTDTCKAFIDKLVSFNRGFPYDSGSDLLKHLTNRTTSDDAGIFFGSPGVNYRQIYIGVENVGRKFYTPEQLKRANQIYASTLLHELIHTLTRGIDDDLTQNVLDLGIVAVDHNGKPLPLPKNKGGGSGTDYHLYWSAALKNACFPDLR